MEIPLLEIPEDRIPPAKTGGEDDGGLDVFDISYLLGLTEAAKMPADAEKYIVFKLDRETFGVSLKNVREVCRFLPVASLPNVPRWLSGVANLRGNLLAVIDLRNSGADDLKAKMIVLTDKQRQLCIGLMVDQIVEIAALSAENIAAVQPSEAFSAASFVSGKALYLDSSILILDTSKLLSSPKLRSLREH